MWCFIEYLWMENTMYTRQRLLLGLLLLGEGLDDLLLLGLQAFLTALTSLLGLGPPSFGLVAARSVKEFMNARGSPQTASRKPLPPALASFHSTGSWSTKPVAEVSCAPVLTCHLQL